jgi:hypothetical protein
MDGETGILFRPQGAVALAQAVRAAETTAFDGQRIRRHAERFGKSRFQREMLAAIGRVCDVDRGTSPKWQNRAAQDD